jgi:aspartate racemase
MKPTIGILGGIGPEASAKFYGEVIKQAQRLNLKSNKDYPHIILESIPAPELLFDNLDITMYAEGIKNLEKAGSDFIVIACNTAHSFIEEFKKVVNIPIIDLSKEVETILRKKNVKSITVFGSKRTISKLFHFDNITLKDISDEESKEIDSLIFEYNRGSNKELSRKRVIDIVRKYSDSTVLIACTELSTMMTNSNLNYIDTFDILLNAALNKWREG